MFTNCAEHVVCSPLVYANFYLFISRCFISIFDVVFDLIKLSFPSRRINRINRGISIHLSATSRVMLAWQLGQLGGLLPESGSSPLCQLISSSSVSRAKNIWQLSNWTCHMWHVQLVRAKGERGCTKEGVRVGESCEECQTIDRWWISSSQELHKLHSDVRILWESLETELDERTTSKSGELMLLELVNEQWVNKLNLKVHSSYAKKLYFVFYCILLGI